MFESLIEQIKNESDPFVKAKLLRKAINDFGFKEKQIAQSLGIKPSYLCHFLRLNKLPALLIDGFYNQNITLSHLLVISRLKTNEQMISVYEKVLSQSLTVNQTEELVRETLYQIKSEGDRISKEEKESYLKNLPQDIKLKIIQTRIKGKIIIEVKGSLKKTTFWLKKILDKLKEFLNP